jgi:hypothetical protein
MEVFISKYALTTGILKINAEACFNVDPDMIQDKTSQYPSYYHKGDWHRTREEAVAKAEEMRIRKIASLKKNIKKLETLKF